MELKLEREEYTSKSTIGRLFVNGLYECHTLEDKDRMLEANGTKIKGITAIPRGRYEVIINYSNRFQQYMPLLLNVPQFEGVRIHSGNTSENTEGCILVGNTKDKDFIGESRLAYQNLMKKLKSVEKREKIFITIK